ncbi:MAG: endonuclease III domain-containing protein [Candidatus Binatia bacterium]|jgi:endonuclease-3 related protein|nr:endonuclease III domain-containing protein [Candidatus Binatia bacterium]
MQVYRRLYGRYGDLHWWPGETPLEISVGAILTQNTAWTNVEKAIEHLKEKRALSVAALSRLSHTRLARLVKSAGYFNVKARRLKNFNSFISSHFGGSLKRMLNEETHVLREKLLSVNGTGPETADSILLYAAGKPIFVIDAYTKRILSRHGVMPYERSYEDYQRLFMKHLRPDVPLYNQFHAMLVYAGKDYCRRRPLCESCPLNGWRKAPPLKAG